MLLLHVLGVGLVLIHSFEHEPEVLEGGLQTLKVLTLHLVLDQLDECGVESLGKDSHIEGLADSTEHVHADLHGRLANGLGVGVC